MASRHVLDANASGLSIAVEGELISGGTNITINSITVQNPGLDAHRVILVVLTIDAVVYSVELRMRDEAYESQLAKQQPGQEGRGYLRRA